MATTDQTSTGTERPAAGRAAHAADADIWPPDPDQTGTAAARAGDAPAVHPSVIALDRYIDSLGPHFAALAHDLGESGFGPFALGRAKTLFEHFARATDGTRRTAAARFPWTEVRTLALRLAQETSAAGAGLELIDGLIRQAARRPVPHDMTDQLSADRRSILARVERQPQPALPVAEEKAPARPAWWPPARLIWLGGAVVASLVAVFGAGWLAGGWLAQDDNPVARSAALFAAPQAPPDVPALRDESWSVLVDATLPSAAAGTSADPGLEAAPDLAGDGAVIDLLDVGAASRVQQQLADLGYFDGGVDGIWGPRSRAALLEFKRGNGLAQDERLDRDTGGLLFSVAAMPAGEPPHFDAAAWENERHSLYPPPRGGTLNPLNQADAIQIQDRLAELGFYPKRGDGVWGLASRQALQDFKTLSGLAVDDVWNAVTERRLGATDAPRATNTIIGLWSHDVAQCPAVGDPQVPMLRITTQSLDVQGRACVIDAVSKSGRNWQVSGQCGGAPATFQFAVFGDRLIDQADRGRPYLRCHPDLTPRSVDE